MIMSDIRNENQQYIYVLDAEYQNIERHTESTDLKECSQVNPVQSNANVERHTESTEIKGYSQVNPFQSNPFQSRKFKWSRINTCILLAAVLIATCMSFVSVILQIGLVGMANERASNISKTLFENQNQLLSKLSEMKKYMDNLEATNASRTLYEDQKEVLDKLSEIKKSMDNFEATNASRTLYEDQKEVLDKLSEMKKYIDKFEATKALKTLSKDQKQVLNTLSEMKKYMDNLEATNASRTLYEDQKEVLDKLSEMKTYMDNFEGRYFTIGPRDCSDIRSTQSGIYTIYPDDVHYISAYCDMTTESRGLTVVQRRLDGTTSFFRSWDEYKQGFGGLDSEFWIGNENLHIMTTARKYMVRIDLEDFNGNTKFATYSIFTVGNETSKYQLHVNGYVGTAGDSFGKDNGAFFSTYDSDNDKAKGHCAKNERKGGWWYRQCGAVNINGPFKHAKYRGWDAIYWWDWLKRKPLKSTRMSIKPL